MGSVNYHDASARFSPSSISAYLHVLVQSKPGVPLGPLIRLRRPFSFVPFHCEDSPWKGAQWPSDCPKDPASYVQKSTSKSGPKTGHFSVINCDKIVIDCSPLQHTQVYSVSEALWKSNHITWVYCALETTGVNWRNGCERIQNPFS